VDIIGIEGSDVGLEYLGKCSSISMGVVTITKPLELVRQVRSIYQNAVIATNVQVTLLLPSSLTFKKESILKEDQLTDKQVSKLVRNIGNATADSDLTFEFTPRSESEMKKLTVSSLPFQVQITYTKHDGWKCVRIITKEKPLTKDRKQAEKGANVAVVSLNAVQAAARIAQNGGDAKAARAKLNVAAKLAKRAATDDERQEEYYNFIQQSEDLDSELKKMETSKKSDNTARVLFQYAQAPKAQFVSSGKKEEVINRRRVAESKQEKVKSYGSVEHTY